MPNLTSQMEAVCRRFEELSIRLNQPETAADPAQFRRLMQEYHEAQPVVDAYHALTTAQDHLAQAKALLEGDEPLDADFKAMVQQELSEKSQDGNREKSRVTYAPCLPPGSEWKRYRYG